MTRLDEIKHNRIALGGRLDVEDAQWLIDQLEEFEGIQDASEIGQDIIYNLKAKIKRLEDVDKIGRAAIGALEIVKAERNELLLKQPCPEEREDGECGYSQGEARFWYEAAEKSRDERDKLKTELEYTKDALACALVDFNKAIRDRNHADDLRIGLKIDNKELKVKIEKLEAEIQSLQDDRYDLGKIRGMDVMKTKLDILKSELVDNKEVYEDAYNDSQTEIERLRGALESLQRSSELQAGTLKGDKIGPAVIEWYQELCKRVLEIVNDSLQDNPTTPDLLERFENINLEVPMSDDEAAEVLDATGIDPDAAYKRLQEKIEEIDNSMVTANPQWAAGQINTLRKAMDDDTIKIQDMFIALETIERHASWHSVLCSMHIDYMGCLKYIEQLAHKAQKAAANFTTTNESEDTERQLCCGRLKPGHRTDCQECEKNNP
ncbi:MAG TPA: hypothetical protein VMX17_15745 [Candidatus Glassbacteria bacterium]|nr:hypothetical protein [Candidatus Glassbacteria bacterium]